MKSYGPTQLLKVNDLTIIEHQIRTIKEYAPHANIVVVIGYQADSIIRKIPRDICIVENCSYSTTNECEDLRLAINASTTEKILIISSSLLFNTYSLNCVTNDKSCIVVDSTHQIPETEVGVTIVNDRPTIFAYGIEPKWAHITFLVGKELTFLRNLCNKKEAERHFVFEALNIVLDRNTKFETIEPENMQLKLINT
jgi:hypothetical protein